jgi:hypothetical protein
MPTELELVRAFAAEVLSEVEYFHGHVQHAVIPDGTQRGLAERLAFNREGPIGYLKAKCGDAECSYVLCRSGNPGGRGAKGDYLSKRAPVGRLASLMVGDSVVIPLPAEHPILPPKPTQFTLLAKDLFRTLGKDAVDNSLCADPSLPARYIPSLRDLLSGAFTIEDIRARKRPAIEAISLRDQPVVDAQQDPLVRLPINIPLIISGAPGTGKTTVLISRLDLKTSPEDLVASGELSPNERSGPLFDSGRTWVLFTPTELLSNYIKDSLGRAGLAASGQTVRIWSDYRTEIARDFLRLLKVGRSSAPFRRVAEHEQQAVSDAQVLRLFSSFQEALDKSDLDQRADQRLARRKKSAPAGSVQLPTSEQRLVQRLVLIPKYYKLFRRRNPTIKNFYRCKPRPDSITEHELDVVILVMLNRFRSQLGPQLRRGDSALGHPYLDRLAELLHTVVAVDEATDFSTVQLACMYAITHPRFNSLTLSGDLMQRLTDYGLAQWETLKPLIPGVRIEFLKRCYRQSPALLAVAAELYQLSVGQPAPFVSAYDESDYDQVPPLLLEDAAHSEAEARWICERIIEIYQIHQGKLPSIALFVPQEKDITPLYEAIADKLAEDSIVTEPCPGGRILGNQAKVRIFSVAFIKGLEFEAVFFLHLDLMHEQNPGLVDKFLYVGLSRARTFLAVTSSASFPSTLARIKPLLVAGDWAEFIVPATQPAADL